MGWNRDLQPMTPLFLKIIQWISEPVPACHSFDLIQEFIVGECCRDALLSPTLDPFARGKPVHGS